MAPIFTGFRFGFGKRRGGPRLRRIISSFTSPGSVSVPSGAIQVVIKAHGKSSPALNPSPNPSGGYVEGTFTNLSNTTLNVNFGGGGDQGSQPAKGSRGGDYAGVFNGPVSFSNSLMIAGGAGGPNLGGPVAGGLGGGTSGAGGSPGAPVSGSGTPGTGGGGGSQVSGGSAGSTGSPVDPWGGGATAAGAGSQLQGGVGGSAIWWSGNGGGAGGGGYYGGGGGGAGYGYPGGFGTGASGGGGSSYIHPTASSAVDTQGGSLYNNGYVEISYQEYV